MLYNPALSLASVRGEQQWLVDYITCCIFTSCIDPFKKAGNGINIVITNIRPTASHLAPLLVSQGVIPGIPVIHSGEGIFPVIANKNSSNRGY